MPTHMVNIRAKFHSNSPLCTDIASIEMGVNGQQTNRQKSMGSPLLEECISPLCDLDL